MPNVEFIPLSLVDDYDKNSNTHPQAQIENIKALMLYVGWTFPALVRKTGERYGLIAGHGRREAANELQGKPLKMADGTPIPAGCIPVLFADGWSDEQIRTYVIADNQVPRQSIFDESILSEELRVLQDGGLDLGMIGFGEGELERLLGDVEEIDFPELADGDREPFTQKTFTLHDEQAAIVDDAILKAKTFPQYDAGLNENSNGNALAFICEQWLKNG